MKRNLTVQLDESTIQKARIIATRRSTSISRLVRDEIERVAEKDSAWQAAKRTALTQLNSPFHMGGGSLPNREILHER
jgi:hypothetical protein